MWRMTLILAGIGLLIHRIIHILVTKPWSIWPASNMNLYGPNSRKLGYMEQIYAKLASFGVYNPTFVLILKSREQLIESVIREALLALSERHPLLRMRLGKEGECFTYMTEMNDFMPDFQQCVSTDWKSETEELTKQIFDAEEGPLWRVRFLPNAADNGKQGEGIGSQSVCVFAFHHAIADALSCCHLFKEFIKMIEENTEANELTTEPMSLLPPMEYYVQSDSFQKTLKWNTNVFLSLIRVALYSIVENSFLSHHFKKKIPESIPQNTKLLKCDLTKKQTSDLLLACKKHGVTVQAALQTAMSVATVEICSDENTKKDFCALLPINMRPYLKSNFPQDYLGSYFNVINTTTEISPNLPFWCMATQINLNLKEKVKSQEQVLNMARLPSAWKGLVSEVDLGHSEKVDLFLSNFGNLTFLDNDDSLKVNLEALYVCSSLSGLEQEFANYVVTFNGKLFWSLLYHGFKTSESRAEMFQDLVMQTLLRAVEE